MIKQKFVLVAVFLLFLLATQTILAKIEFEETAADGANNVDKNYTQPAKLFFTANVTNVVNGRPFLATCTVKQEGNFGTIPIKKQNYVVRFYRSNDYRKLLIARHEVFAPTPQHPKRRYLFSTIRQDDLEVAPGRHARWPTFDLVILPLYSPLQNYWCELTTGGWNPQLEEEESMKAATVENDTRFQFNSTGSIVNDRDQYQKAQLLSKPKPVNNKQTKCWDCYTTISPFLTTGPYYNNGSSNNNNGSQPQPIIKIVSNVFVQTPILTLSIEDYDRYRYRMSCQIEHFTQLLINSSKPFSYAVSFQLVGYLRMGVFKVKELKTSTKGEEDEDSDETSYHRRRRFMTTFTDDKVNVYYRELIGHGPNFEYPLFQVEMKTGYNYYQEHVCKLSFNDNLDGEDSGVAGGQNGTSTEEYTREIVSNIVKRY